MSSESETTEPETVAVTHEYIVDEQFSARTARAFTAFTLGRPPMIVCMALLTVLGLFLLVIGPWIDNTALIAIGVAYILFGPAYGVLIYARTRRSNSQRLPAGSRIAVGLGETTMRTEGPLGSGNTSYRAYRSVAVRGGFVILRHQGIRVFSVFPAELFSGGGLDRLRMAVHKANS